jgi:uncharacterized membrane protein
MSVQITESIIIKGAAEEVFNQWTNLDILPSVIKDIKEVRQLDGLKSHWVVKGPLGKEFEWTAEVTRFDEDRRVAWKTLEGDIKTSGQVTFKDLPDNETEVTVQMVYVPPAGKVGEAVSKVLANPREKVSDGLREFKTYVEKTFIRGSKDINKD